MWGRRCCGWLRRASWPKLPAQIDKEISEFDFGAETKARLVNVDLQPLEGFYSTLTKVVQAKASA